MMDGRCATPYEWIASFFEYLEENEYYDYCAGDALFCKCGIDWRDLV